ncbi:MULTISPECIES: Fis family transcriptional regulator [Methylovorus]|jgi:Fis family transcriptional regulator|uniref:Putative Fis-like DNA-binding protein n=1 Tax=Methylovorus glucosotrophus (strain SIP3-4) TaxID=582744 RepID=C6X910_METGS|nr:MULTISPECIES: Fis family transcriptional regulator [Methylovorus]HWU35513.1 Fis family transcriptional regulator [Methylovorus sp.]ACT49630.1 transcriptional regulator, Fis family [Methylovorus glucosotrophus SIP3-4]ADQ83581.1 transcriptional regulator, Fis family [Methylovorus sp. MP688]KAF0836243.1 Fis family transcriptional regulator [Methylovorus glucosotrophus]MCB4810274.1 Fis family transcriptional regulator [Methylovorus menthalis]
MSNKDVAACIRAALDEYFKDLDGQPPHAVYDMVMGCVEKPMLEYVLHRAGGNQSKAAEILGLNRNTLRKKMQLYQIE